MRRVIGDWVEIYYSHTDLAQIDLWMREMGDFGKATISICLDCVELHGLTAMLDLFAWDDGFQELPIVGFCPRCGRIYGIGKWRINRTFLHEKREGSQ